MSARDTYHDAVKNALIKDGWTITHDPYTLIIGEQKLFVDLGAERPIAAERNGQKIAVEVKSFLTPSLIHELQQALGQYRMYLFFLHRHEPDRILYLAIDTDTYKALFRISDVRELLENDQVQLLVADIEKETVEQWIK